jgi:ammonia channel protein AmtB
VLAAVVWLVAALTAALPAWLLLTNADSRLPQAAGTALIVAGVVAIVAGAACARGRSGLSLGASGGVVLLCLAALIALGVDSGVSLIGGMIFGGATAALALLAGVLTLRYKRRGLETDR